MKNNTYSYYRAGMPALGIEEIYAFGQEHYRELLREAEEYRLALRSQRPNPNRPARSRLTPQMVGQFFAHLLSGRSPYAHTSLQHARKSL